jgi:Uma2 family endonuclease
MAALPEFTWTEERYLAFERESDQKHEYLDMQIYDLAGASTNHNLIVGSAYAHLYNQLRKRPCFVYPSDMRLKVSKTRLYTYPDISIVCGTPQFDDEQKDTILNPIVLIEVLSPSTESYDRGKKFRHYRTLESLQEYVLIAQDSIQIEHYSRQADEQWLLNDISQPDASLDLRSIGCTLLAADMYEKVTFDEQE